MKKPIFSRRVVERAVEGKSTILADQDYVRTVTQVHSHRSMDIALIPPFLESEKVRTLEQQLVELKQENQRYREAVRFLLFKTRIALDLTESLLNFLSDELSTVKNVREVFVFKSGQVTNIWIQLSRRDVDSEMTVAETETKIFRLFPKTKLRFLVVPRGVANLSKEVPHSAKRVRLSS